MKLIIDLQACQTTGSRDRGIGRYTFSLVDAMVRDCREHEVLIAINRAFPETIGPTRDRFSGVLPPENVIVWGGLLALEEMEAKNLGRRLLAERAKETLFKSLGADVVYTTSLFEGLGDSSVTSVSNDLTNINAVTLYDLIPYIHPQLYLADERVEDWYKRRILQLQQSDVALAISESSRREGIDYLGLPEHATVNISCAADSIFHPLNISTQLEAEIRQKYSLQKQFVMYTGGIDFRKNIEGLIESYADLPSQLRATHQLAIVCRVRPEDVARLSALAAQAGLNEGDVIFTGFVSDEDLAMLYNLCKIFIFPSIHEGFGLPALEAMSCGAAVIGSNCTSIPEVIGRPDALFNPLSRQDITAKLSRALSDQDFLLDLKESGLKRADGFSWKRSGSLAWDALENCVEDRQRTSRFRAMDSVSPKQDTLPTLAYVSPIPPDKSGIATYSAMVVPALCQHYQIDVVCDIESTDEWIKRNIKIISYKEFRENAGNYDRIVYHFGNSHFHTRMPELLKEAPGVVVLHDFFLSGLFWTLQASGAERALDAELEHSHGHFALADHLYHADPARSMAKYPCNLSVLENATGVISHSAYSRQLAERWYGISDHSRWSIVPLPWSAAKTAPSRDEAREMLGIKPNTFVVCSFGIIYSPTKLNDVILDAWADSNLGQTDDSLLVFVGQGGDISFDTQFERLAKTGKITNCKVTGYVSDTEYQAWLHASDLCVQLRAKSRGESSAAVLDGMVAGKNVVVNAYASAVELPDDVVTKLSEKPGKDELANILKQFHDSPHLSAEIGNRAASYVRAVHDPAIVSAQYANIIEEFYRNKNAKYPQENANLLHSVSQFGFFSDDRNGIQWQIAAIDPDYVPTHRFLIDISDHMSENFATELGDEDHLVSIVQFMLDFLPANRRIFMVRRLESGEYEAAHDLPYRLLNRTPPSLPEWKHIALWPNERAIPLDEFSSVLYSN
jgi:glycosyltransferase involved in cell wall biosynthesis